MSLDWHAAWQALIHHPLFGVGITLGAYQLALAAYERNRWLLLKPLLQPVLLSMLAVIGVLLACGLSYREYQQSAQLLIILLGPATVALAVPLFVNLRRIRGVTPSIGDGYDLALDDGSEVEVSRRQARELRERMAL